VARVDPNTPWMLVVIFAVAGVLHFALTDTYARIVPRWLPAARTLVYVSGVAEIAGAVGLMLPQLREAAGWGLIALLVAVLPANVQMLQSARGSGAAAWWQALLWARLPLQLVLIWWVWRAAVRPG
jgi:uncharacterized membrane protein